MAKSKSQKKSSRTTYSQKIVGLRHDGMPGRRAEGGRVAMGLEASASARADSDRHGRASRSRSMAASPAFRSTRIGRRP